MSAASRTYSGAVQVQAFVLDGLRVSEARELIEHPIFGDERHIRAVKMLSMLEESAALVGREDETAKYPCPCCEASGRTRCGCCERDIDCHLCGGAGYISSGDVQRLEFWEVEKIHALALKEAVRA